MNFREFRRWCNDRACDGCWSLDVEKFCIGLLDNMQKIPFWKKRKAWNKIKNGVIHAVVIPTNIKIQERRGITMPLPKPSAEV